MISYKIFKETIEALLKQDEKEDRFSDNLLEFTDGARPLMLLSKELTIATFNLLEEIFDDKNGWIAWWYYDNDKGKGNLKAWCDNHKKIKLKTIKDLYNYLVRNKNDNINRRSSNCNRMG